MGGNFIRLLLGGTPEFKGRIINLDSLTYAGNTESLKDIENQFGPSSPSPRYIFELGDISDRQGVERIFRHYSIDTVVHFAAESHVDRSILGPEAFIKTNVTGAYTLLETARTVWLEGGSIRRDVLFHQISTGEVYGSLGGGTFSETAPYSPRSPYSASKAAGDHLVMAYHYTHGLPITLSNSSNNYGPYQFPEKLIPFMILCMLEGKPLPIYGDGKNIRDWIHVEDHNRAIWAILNAGKNGEKYNIGGESEWENIRLLVTLIDVVAEKAGLDAGKVRSTITFVKNRPGHAHRYAIDCSKIKRELGWARQIDFEEGLARTVDWYIANLEWVEHIRSGAYRHGAEDIQPR
jgi:dTDP-glucose 4,6-dehydratase